MSKLQVLFSEKTYGYRLANKKLKELDYLRLPVYLYKNDIMRKYYPTIRGEFKTDFEDDTKLFPRVLYSIQILTEPNLLDEPTLASGFFCGLENGYYFNA